MSANATRLDINKNLLNKKSFCCLTSDTPLSRSSSPAPPAVANPHGSIPCWPGAASAVPSRQGDQTAVSVGGGAGDVGSGASDPVPSLGSYRITNRDPKLRRFRKDGVVAHFVQYLRSTAQCKFILHGSESSNKIPEHQISKEVEYIHRWTPIYRKAIIAKMYLLEKEHNRNPRPITMGTFTTYQDGKYSISVSGKNTIDKSFTRLKRGWNLIRMYLRYYHPDISFVYFFEPHKSGYPHLHVIFFGEIPESLQNKIKTLWSDKYKIGSFEHGVDFRPITELKSVRNYVIKYISKILRQDKIDDWTDGELYFNAIMWREKYRLWGASQDLSKAMRKPFLEVDADEVGLDADEILSYRYQWDYTELITDCGDSIVVKKRDGYLIPPD